MLRSNNPPLGLFILRVGLGAIFLMHGLGKLVGPPFAGQGMAATTGFMASLGFPLPAVTAWLAMLVETVGGAALVLGSGARVAALLLAIEMVVAAVKFDLGRGFAGGYELNLALITGLLCVVLGGPGILAIQLRSKS